MYYSYNNEAPKTQFLRKSFNNVNYNDDRILKILWVTLILCQIIFLLSAVSLSIAKTYQYTSGDYFCIGTAQGREQSHICRTQ